MREGYTNPHRMQKIVQAWREWMGFDRLSSLSDDDVYFWSNARRSVHTLGEDEEREGERGERRESHILFDVLHLFHCNSKGWRCLTSIGMRTVKDERNRRKEKLPLLFNWWEIAHIILSVDKQSLFDYKKKKQKEKWMKCKEKRRKTSSILNQIKTNVSGSFLFVFFIFPLHLITDRRYWKKCCRNMSLQQGDQLTSFFQMNG